MGKTLKNERQMLIERIRSRRATSNEINHQIERFQLHIQRDDLSTLENYPDKFIIKEIIEAYPHKLNSNDVNAITQHKNNKFMYRLYDDIFNKRLKIQANPLIIKMLKNHIHGKEDDNISFQGQQFIIQNYLEPTKTGSIIEAEPKLVIENDS